MPRVPTERNDVLRARAAQRSREAGYSEERPGIFAVGDDGCDHVLDAEGACLHCDRQIVSRVAVQHG